MFTFDDNNALIANQKWMIQTPQKQPITNYPEMSTNYCEGVTTTEQNDKIYLMNMELSKFQNSNVTHSGSFAPMITNIIEDKENFISSFDLENSSSNNKNNNNNDHMSNDSYITLKDLNVTPIQETHSVHKINTNEDELQCTPISTICNYYLQSETNTQKSVNKTKEMLYMNSNTHEHDSSDKKHNVMMKYLTVNKKINFNNTYNTHDTYFAMEGDNNNNTQGNRSNKGNNIKIVRITSRAVSNHCKGSNNKHAKHGMCNNNSKERNKQNAIYKSEIKFSFETKTNINTINNNNVYNNNNKKIVIPKKIQLLKPRSASETKKTKKQPNQIQIQQQRSNSLSSNNKYNTSHYTHNSNNNNTNTNNKAISTKAVYSLKHKQSISSIKQSKTTNTQFIKDILHTIQQRNSLSKHKSSSKDTNTNTKPPSTTARRSSKLSIPISTPNSKPTHITYTPYTTTINLTTEQSIPNTNPTRMITHNIPSSNSSRKSNNQYTKLNPKSKSQSRQCSGKPLHRYSLKQTRTNNIIPCFSTTKKQTSFIKKYQTEVKSQLTKVKHEHTELHNSTINTSKHNSHVKDNSMSNRQQCLSPYNNNNNITLNQTQSTRHSTKPCNTDICETIPTSKGVKRLLHNNNNKYKLKSKTKAKIVNVSAIQHDNNNNNNKRALSASKSKQIES